MNEIGSRVIHEIAETFERLLVEQQKAINEAYLEADGPITLSLRVKIRFETPSAEVVHDFE